MLTAHWKRIYFHALLKLDATVHRRVRAKLLRPAVVPRVVATHHENPAASAVKLVLGEKASRAV